MYFKKNASKKLIQLFLFFFAFSFILCANSKPKKVKCGYIAVNDGFMRGLTPDDPKGGYAYEYLQKISGYTGWEYDYMYGDWTVLTNAFREGKIDILVDLSYTKERESYASFPSFPMGTETYFIYVRDETSGITSDPKSLEGKTICLSNTEYYLQLINDFISENKINCTIVPSDDDIKRYNDFSNGKYDAIVETNLINIYNWKPAIKLCSSNFYLAVNKNREDLFLELESALLKLYSDNPFFNPELYNRYFSEIKLSRKFSDEENSWLSVHRVIKVGCLKNYLPFSDYDLKNSCTVGLVRDFLENLCTLFDIPGVDFQYKFYQTREQLEAALINNDIDFSFPSYEDLYSSENSGIHQTDSFISTNLSIFYIGNYGPSKLRRMGILKNCSFAYNYVRNKYPNAKLTEFDNCKVLLQAIRSGEIDSGVISNYQASAWPKRDFKRIKSIILSEPANLCFSVKRSELPLLHILNVGIGNFDKTKIPVLITNYITGTLDFSIPKMIHDYSAFFLIILIFFVLMISFSIFSIDRFLLFSDIDSVTFALNGRKFHKNLIQTIDYSNLQNKPLTLLLVDLDDFKHVNEIYGRECANNLLKEVATIITRCLKRNDKVFRWKCDQFMILLDCNADVAAGCAERVRREIERAPILFHEAIIDVTATVSVSAYHKGLEPEILVDDVVKKVAQGKQNGKNKLVR